MTDVTWNAISAISNVVMAVTAVVAALYALKQYQQALKVHEMNQVIDMHKTLSEFFDKAVSGEADEHVVDRLLIMMEMHERLIANGYLSSFSEKFYRDAMGFDKEFAEEDGFTRTVKSILQRNENQYVHLVKWFNRNPNTRAFVNW